VRQNIPDEFVEQWKVIGPVLDALGSTVRQHIITLFEPNEKINIKNIAERFNLSRTAVVHHINTLLDAGVLKSERVGKEMIMSVDWEMVSMAVDKVIAYAVRYGLPVEKK
jgi:predicted transcriptional regulator